MQTPSGSVVMVFSVMLALFYKYLVILVLTVTFTALTLLIGRQEE